MGRISPLFRLATRYLRVRVIEDLRALRNAISGSGLDDPGHSIARAKSFRLSGEIARNRCRRPRKREQKVEEEERRGWGRAGREEENRKSTHPVYEADRTNDNG